MNRIEKTFLIVPLAVLATAFGIICVRFGTIWPWQVIAHEDGRHTLLGTIFYFEHALGELPLDVLLAAAMAGAALWFFPTGAARPVWRFAAASILLDATILGGAAFQAGRGTALEYLLQFHTRDDEPMIYGSHWRYHLLSQTALMLLAFLLVSIAARESKPARRLGVLIAAWCAFGLLTIVFGISPTPFTDARYLGHQARELFTHSLVTLPLAAACCMWASGSIERRLAWKAPPAAPSIAFVMIAVYLGAGVLRGHAAQLAQSSDWVKVVCTHFFEHTLSYLVVPVHAIWFYLAGARHT